jgi:excisionase family DNA binding protein
MTAPTSKWITPINLSERWGIDRKTVLSAIKRGEIPTTMIGRTWLIPMPWVRLQEHEQLEETSEPRPATSDDINDAQAVL